MKQGFSSDQLQHYVKKLIQTAKIPDKLILTKEQLVQIIVEEDISLAEGICFAIVNKYNLFIVLHFML